MSPSSAAQGGHAAPDDYAGLLLESARELVREVRPRTRVTAITLDSRLDRDLGLDSLAIVELAARLEDAFGVQIPERAVADAETLGDFLEVATKGTARQDRPGNLAAPEPLTLEPVATPDDARTLVEVLEWHADHHGDRMHIRILGDQGPEELDYQTLRDDALVAAGALRDQGVGRGSSVALMLPTGRDYFTAFFGALFAGGVPVPVYPPTRRAQIEEHLRRHVSILDNAEAVVLVTVAEARRLSRLISPQIPTLRRVLTPSDLRGGPPAKPAAPGPDDVALLQYTSGSTGDPKGVVLSHANLLANIGAMGSIGEVSPTDVFVSWLPLYHDMGLIGAWLTSLRFAFPLVVMSPLSFLARPARWLRAIHEHGGTISGGPNFGFELCLRRIDDDELDGVDLSSWRIAFNGAEPVSPDTVTRFGERFAPFGLRREVLTPVYGLAECAVALTVPPLERGPRIEPVAREPLQRRGRAEPAGQGAERPLGHVACGPPLPDHEVRIVDDAGRALPERHEGRIQFRGPSATSGYHRNPAATRQLFDGTWLNTGDLGYLAEGELFVTGRRKDLIIRAGRNLHPAELEEAVGELPGVRRGCVAAFASTDQRTGTERLVVVAETREAEEAARERIRRAINETAADLLGAPPDEVVLAPPRAVPKTSSGKVRRSAARERYERGTLRSGRAAAWLQVARLAVPNAIAQVRRAGRSVKHLAYGTYAWTVFLAIGVPTWLVVLVVPGRQRRWRLVRRAGRLLLGLCGIGLTVEGGERLPDRPPYVVVANHTSYLDPLVLAVVVPHPLVFAAHVGLAAKLTVRLFLSRMGAHLVGGGQRRRDEPATHALEEAVAGGHAVAFFPEGTRTVPRGLGSFRMGAFVVGARAGVPVVPVAIRGTRHVLPAERALPRRGDVEVVVADPIRGDEPGWRGAAHLQQAARRAILRHLDEPDLG